MPKAWSCPRTLQRWPWTAACAPLSWKSTSGFRWGAPPLGAALMTLLAQPAFQTACLQSEQVSCRMLSAPYRLGNTRNAGGRSPSDRRVCMVQGKTFAGWLARTFPPTVTAS